MPAAEPVLTHIASQPLEFLAVTGSSDLRPYLDGLAALAAQTAAPASVHWSAVQAWIEPRRELELVTLLVLRNAHVVGAAFLAERVRGGILRCQKAGQIGEPYELMAVDDAAAQQLASGIVSHLASSRRAWELRLTDLPEDNFVINCLREKLPAMTAHFGAQTPQMRFQDGRGINEYLSRNVRSAVAKARNRVRREHDQLELRWSTEHDAIVGRLNEIVSARDTRDRAMHRYHYDPAELPTFVATVTGHARGGRVRLLQVLIDDKLASFAVCFKTARSLWVYSNAVSPAYTRYSAGTIANAEVVRYAHADPGIDVLSWGAGLQRYKMSGRVEILPSLALTAWSSDRTRLALRILRTVRRGAGRRR